MNSPLLSVDDLRVSFHTDAGPARAVDGVSFTLDANETVGLVGESGCGKSLTALSLLRLLPPGARVAPQSTITFEGRNVLALPEPELRTLRGRRVAMVFQEPMTALNPVLRVGDQIAEVVRTHTRASRREADERAVEMLGLVGIPDPAVRARQYPHELSGGMRQRVMIAMALVLEPALLVADEPTTALDVTIQAQILELLTALRERTRMAMLLITHDLGVVAETASRVLVMYAGQVVEEAPAAALFAAPAHPYTEGLLAAVPRLAGPDGAAETDGPAPPPLRTIPGAVPPPTAWPAGCRFRERCAHAWDRCTDEEPPFVQIGPAHRVRCHLAREPERRRT